MRVIGHRGAAALAPENTLGSFRAAIDAGADAVELDARLTRDGHLVLMHDDDVSRTTDGRGFVSQMTLEEVRALDAGARSKSGRERARVPTLGEAIEMLAGRVGIVVELKGGRSKGGPTASAVAEAVSDLIGGIADVTISSFNHASVARMRAIRPGIRTGITTSLFIPVAANLDAALRGGHEECHVPDPLVDAAFIDRAHVAAREVHAWTVNDPARLRALRDLGCDGVFTDDPGASRAALER